MHRGACTTALLLLDCSVPVPFPQQRTVMSRTVLLPVLGLCVLALYSLLQPPAVLEVACPERPLPDLNTVTYTPTVEEEEEEALGPGTRRVVQSMRDHGVAVVEGALPRDMAASLRRALRERQGARGARSPLQRWLDSCTINEPANRNHTVFAVDEVEQPLVHLVRVLQKPLEELLGPVCPSVAMRCRVPLPLNLSAASCYVCPFFVLKATCGTPPNDSNHNTW